MDNNSWNMCLHRYLHGVMWQELEPPQDLNPPCEDYSLTYVVISSVEPTKETREKFWNFFTGDNYKIGAMNSVGGYLFIGFEQYPLRVRNLVKEGTINVDGSTYTMTFASSHFY